jgi:hypothetical protein
MQILPCTKEHIPGVVALLGEGAPQVGSGRDAAGPNALARYLEDVYLDNPWFDPELPSLVCADGDGRIDGFLGVVARPMALRGGQAIRAAASSNFRVRGGERGGPRNPLIAMRLLKRFFEGPQDLSVANGANPLSKKIWEGCGGVSVPLCSLDWFRPIRPARGLLELAAGGRSKPWPRALRRLSDVADVVAGSRLALRALRDDRGAEPVLATLDPQTAVEHLARAPGFDLVPRYDAASFAWLLDMCRRKALGGRLRAMAASEPQGRDLGWFVYYEKRPRVGEVVQLVAAEGRLEAVLRAAIADAAAQGLALLRGDVDARDLQAYRDALCLLNTGRWMLVHSRRQAIVDSFMRGSALFSGLDGERWIREFGRAPI